MNPSHAAALLFALLSLGICAFQLALIFGAPWGEFTLGGKWRGALPRRARWIPVISLLIFAGLVLIVFAGSGFALAAYQAQAQTWIWGVVGFCALGCVLNAITPSRRERAIWLPVVLGLFATSLSVALLP